MFSEVAQHGGCHKGLQLTVLAEHRLDLVTREQQYGDVLGYILLLMLFYHLTLSILIFLVFLLLLLLLP